jgi:hypothetical protein
MKENASLGRLSVMQCHAKGPAIASAPPLPRHYYQQQSADEDDKDRLQRLALNPAISGQARSDGDHEKHHVIALLRLLRRS